MVVLIGSCSRNVFDSSDILVALSLFMLLNRAKKIAYRSGDDFKHQVLLITKFHKVDVFGHLFGKDRPLCFFLVSDHLPLANTKSSHFGWSLTGVSTAFNTFDSAFFSGLRSWV